MDLTDVDIRRMFPFQATKSYLVKRVEETLGLLFADHWPYRQYASARVQRATCRSMKIWLREADVLARPPVLNGHCFMQARSKYLPVRPRP